MSIGSDRWVESAESRTEGPGGWWGRGKRRWGGLSQLARLGILVALTALVPLAVSSDFLVRVGVNGMLLALLAVGLNVSVGWAGLLDLGFVAFYGFGAYTFALLSSDQLGIHLGAVALETFVNKLWSPTVARPAADPPRLPPASFAPAS